MNSTITETATPVKFKIGNESIRATFNDSTTAKDLLTKLPYSITLMRYQFDYCGTMERPLDFDEVDKHNGWENGEFCMAGIYLSILFDGEEQSDEHAGLISIGRIHDEDLPKVKKMGRGITVTIDRI